MDAIPFSKDADPPVRGFLHRPESVTASSADAIVLTHGAGSNCQAPLLVALAEALAGSGLTVLRCDLSYRQKRPHGPPFRGEDVHDREGLRNAVEALRALDAAGDSGGPAGPNAQDLSDRRPFERIFLGGHSYGGRQATMLAAECAGVASGLLLLSYPLHPPRQPSRPRTDHFAALATRALFVHGTRDPFGSIEAMELALRLISARTALVRIEGAGHDLGSARPAARPALARNITEAFATFYPAGRSD
ncbi:MAG TPA: alpha/beta family hydrolase [Terriglobia bacterium]|jgi:predicted alpha/beta-hydrolase family hydrolase|nr:alpha/beta family hydrolase [Terriglobia bacterium]